MSNKISHIAIYIMAIFFSLLLAMVLAKPAMSFEDKDWTAHQGTTLKVYMVYHPVSYAMVVKLSTFLEKTGIKVSYNIIPEARYFEEISLALAAHDGVPDLFMASPYQLWSYSGKGFVEPLNTYISEKLTPDYDLEDIIEKVLDTFKWDNKPGHSLGQGKLWGLPMAFETCILAYNKRAMDKDGHKVPANFEELLALAPNLASWNGPGSYAVALRGTRDWSSLHSAYLSAYASFGAVDFEEENGHLVSRVNSPEAVKVTENYADLIRIGASPDWYRFTWIDAGRDFGAGKAAFLLDSDANAVAQNWAGVSQEAGNIDYASLPLLDLDQNSISSFWTLGMSINSSSKNKGAAWLFLMYMTMSDFAQEATIRGHSMNPVRHSVWKSERFANKMAGQGNYLKVLEKNLAEARIVHTPQPYFFATSGEWAAVLQDIVLGRYHTQTALDALKLRTDKIITDLKPR